MKEQRVVCAAMRNEQTGLIICSPRHFDARCCDVMKALGQHGDVQWQEATQGFVDNRGEFLTRKEAYKIADAAGQVLPEYRGEGRLYSESLY